MYYVSTIINILCIFTFIIINYLEYSKNIKFKFNKFILIIFIVSAILFMISRNLLK